LFVSNLVLCLLPAAVVAHKNMLFGKIIGDLLRFKKKGNLRRLILEDFLLVQRVR